MSLYDTIGQTYSRFRQPDPRIASALDAALGDAASVVNIGAGAGSYEPRNRTVIAVEPSEVMIRQRSSDLAPCLQGSAESLPLETASVDAAMAILSAHHWSDLERGFREMARVARRRAILLTWVPPDVAAPSLDAGRTEPSSAGNPRTNPAPFWLTEDYFPEILAHDRTIFPSTAALTAMLERTIGPVRMQTLPIPHDCIDGMLAAYWRRPECYLSAERRSAISSFTRIDAESGLARLRADLASGRWAQRNRHLLSLDALDAGYRIVTCEIGPESPAVRHHPGM